MGAMELRRFLDCRLLQHQHVDDLVLHDCRRTVMVASLAVRMARLFLLCMLRRAHWTSWSRLSYWLFRRQPRAVWHLGKHVACFQPSCNG